ncbi:3-oxo-5a-steroid 4- dehydrogenase [Lobosporangium transversale]|uniref:very-long-chain enoyl-CoA reductase n=1 Tax=Lobosporangium transversale TaxID=64571 RepID=A0A1Y2G9Z7_9FUNG|nr:3-oxo-5-alpha-steroid 4-dehydrogenase-domain-containing protein [Lobosporangium transversale]KAF9905953.1 3-oxo-5a-steroid 4- dehydrogenase [Lobosporangium transversale]ORZ00005.1 3-oxo-5-alpha-steroid 4-dehydrogenase-domain-containing protein [Lobosporangium transversale]|eukprot:XP_021876046.1 3-oxo-5-alpha-steroid 4-dehydrogenase-domain-containing protein [Lobosporangium transversale]
MKLTIASRSERSQFILDLTGSPEDVTVETVQNEITKRYSRLYPARQRLTTEKGVLERGKTLADYGIMDGDTVLFKDLGSQISWRTVFLIEYGGPLVIHPLVYLLPSLFYGQNFEHSWMQTVTFWMVMLHFLKREYETIFVHRFSHGTMPFRNVFKNSAHYHLLSGINLAYWVYGPWNAAGTKLAERSDLLIYGCIVLYAFAELSNYHTHVTLRNLRPPGTRVRKIPRGYGFDLVSCPNYLFETLSWLAICILTLSWSAHLFFFVAVGQMYIWAVKKHKMYRKEFSDYPRGRKAMIPLIA